MEFECVRIIVSFHVEFADGVTPLTRWTELRESETCRLRERAAVELQLVLCTAPETKTAGKIIIGYIMNLIRLYV